MEANSRAQNGPSESQQDPPAASGPTTQQLQEEVRQLEAAVRIYQAIERRLRLAVHPQCAMCHHARRQSGAEDESR